jgi:hypothetical protein
MVKRNRREPRTMPELIDTMASRSDLEGFAHMLNGAVQDEKQGSHPICRLRDRCTRQRTA